MIKILLSTFLIIAISQYSRIDAVRYARENVYNIAHTCGYLSDSYLKCTPYAYFGKDYCGYNGNGDDSANYVSQCLVYGGGHEYLNDAEHCRGYRCGFEEPEAIIEDIITGISKTDGKYVKIVDRKEAIKYAIVNGKKGDIIMLIGKGHEDYKEIKGVRYPFDERIIIKEILDEISV
jgi:hypothetical protein